MQVYAVYKFLNGSCDRKKIIIINLLVDVMCYNTFGCALLQLYQIGGCHCDLVN